MLFTPGRKSNMVCLLNTTLWTTMMIAFTRATAPAVCGNSGMVEISCDEETTQLHEQHACVCCIGWDQVKIADCSYRNLEKTPRLRRDINILNLTGNHLHDLANNTFFRYKNLIQLHLRHNNISSLHGDTFTGLCSLELLDLRDNKLDLGTYPPNVFTPLQNLTKLYLNKNNDNATDYPNTALSHLPSLKVLYIDGIPGRSFSTPLSSLASLYMNGRTETTDGYCNMPNLPEDFFENLPNLILLEMRNCSMKNVSKHAFKKATKLEILDLSYNVELTFSGSENVLYGLQQHKKLRKLRLDAINTPDGIGTELSVNFVRFLHNISTLEDLSIENNRLESIARNAIKEYTLNSLRRVNMSKNRMLYWPHFEEVSKLTKLKFLDLSYQGKVWSDRFKRSGTTSALKNIRRPSYDLDEHTDNRYIDLPPLLEELSFSNSKMPSRITHMKFNPHNSLRTLNLSGNALLELIGPIEGLNRLTTLDISSNFCLNISNIFFRNLSTLRHLNMSYNRLYIFENQTGETVLRSLTQLTDLRLIDNHLRSLTNDVFQNLTSIEVLHLTYNSLSTWNVTLTGLKKLNSLILSHNLIRRLNKTAMQEFDRQAGLTNFSLHMYGNVFDCACYDIDFIQWLSDTPVNLINFGQYTCLFDEPPTPVPFYNITHFNEHILGKLKYQCKNDKSKSYLPYVITGTVTFTVAIVTISCILTYRSRWKLRYMYYLSRARYRGYSTLDGNFEFDAFVSYADEDRMFVKGDMVSMLEEEAGLNLCIHHREFIPGLPIEENIAGGIHNSRHVIVVLTEHFVSSHWCMYEFNMARMEDLYKSRDKLIIIIDYRPIRNDLLPNVVKEMRELHTYVTYPQGNADDTKFWRNIVAATKAGKN